MAAAIREIDHEADDEPDHQPKPGYEWQADHEREAESAAALPGVGAVANSLKRAFDEVDAQITKWINHAQLAA
jgi:hypothetical protein